MTAKREFTTRPLAFTDLETTGLDETRHEIIELGLVLVDQPTLEVIDTMDCKIRPEHIETASPKALEVNGYNTGDWKDAESLDNVLLRYSQLTEGAMLASWNYHFEARFLDAAARKVGMPPGLKMDYHMRGIETLAAEVLRNTLKMNRGYSDYEKLQRENMKFVAEFLGIEPEPEPHRAIHGAQCAFEIYKHLRRIIGRSRGKIYASGVRLRL